MRRLSSLRSCAWLAMASLEGLVELRACTPLAAGSRRLFANDGEPSLSTQYRGDRPLLTDREHDDRHTVFPSKRKGGAIHHLEVARDCLLVSQSLVALGVVVLFWVGAVDSIDISRFEHDIGTDLGCPQDRGRIGCEEWIARPCGKDDNATLLKVTQCTAPLIAFAQRRYGQRRHRPGHDPGLFERAFQR